MINVTKTLLPSLEEYTAVLKRSWDKAWITNNGELVQELEQKLKDYLGVKHLFFTNNGTIVLQMALKAFDITGEVLTTPFSYVATTNAILWENAKPIFVDINPRDFCIDASKLEQAITEKTQAILATHVYGYACDVEAIERIAEKHKLKVIYDAAHAFGARYKGQSLLSYGDIATCSFHATKLFHTGEGGCIVTNDDETARKLMLFRQFGHVYDDYFSMGINAKNSELHAAMGLCLLPRMKDVLEHRRHISQLYDAALQGAGLQRPQGIEGLDYNHAYYPVVFASEEALLKARKHMEGSGIYTRRYFYPSLNELPFLEHQPCPVSEDISRRVLCLPMSHEINETLVLQITSLIKEVIC